MPASKRKLDMTNVKDASIFSSKRMPEGDYLAKVLSVEDETSKNDNDMWVFAIQLVDYPRVVYPYYCTLEEKSLFKVRHLFTAAGIDIPRKLQTLDPNRVVGKEIGVALEDDEYNGNERSTITAVMEPEDMMVNNDAPDPDEEDEEEEVKPAKKAPARRTRKPAPVEEEDDEDEEDEEPPARPARRRKPAPEPEPEEDDEEEEEEEPAPKRRTRAKAAPARRKAAPVEEDDEEEDEEEPEPPRTRRKPATRTRATTTRKAAPKRRSAPADDEDEDEMDLEDL